MYEGQRHGCSGDSSIAQTYLDIPMSFEIKLCKTADIPSPIHMHREFSEEVDNSWGTGRKREPQYEWCQQYGKDLLSEYHYFHGEELSECLMYLVLHK